MSRFQFQLGTIGTEQAAQGCVGILQISIPVRYDWNNGIDYELNHSTIFQFQLGTIGTISNNKKRCIYSISIPVRYDWNDLGKDASESYTNFNSS